MIKMQKIMDEWILGCVLTLSLTLTGCAGKVGGELSKTDQSAFQPPKCEPDDGREYSINVFTTAKDGVENPASWLSGATFGLLPTYWVSFRESRATLLKGENELDVFRYKARMHQFYGIPWLPILYVPAKFVAPHNHIPADTSAGLAKERVLLDKAATQAWIDIMDKYDIQEDNICYLDTYCDYFCGMLELYRRYTPTI